MAQRVEQPPRTLWLGLFLLVVMFGLAYWMLSRTQPQNRSPQVPFLGYVGDFTLTNQSGTRVTLDSLAGKVWLADIIFTRCPGPCARMTRQMHEIQAALPVESKARLVSLTTDPEFDTPEILARYAEKNQADPNRWQFLTGDKLQIASLAGDSLKLTALEKPPEERTSADDLFIHSTIFVLVDRQSRLRGIYETGGEDVDWNVVRAEILAMIRQLEEEK